MTGIVIGGSPRSGTTLIQSILSEHPDIFTIPFETYLLVEDNFKPEALQALLGDKWDGLWTEKTPVNVRNIKRILEEIPDVKFIHIIRDARDVCVSFFPGQSRYAVWAEGWVKDVSTGLEFREHPQVYTMFYEKLVAEPKVEIEEFCKFCNITPNEGMFRYPDKPSLSIAPAWTHQAIPVHKEAIGKWKQPQHAERVKEVMETPGIYDLLKRLNYLEE